MKVLGYVVSALLLLAGCTDQGPIGNSKSIIGSGQMPAISKDRIGHVHMSYGSGDSIMYVHSSDNGATFSYPSLVSVLPKLAAAHTRGPQIAATTNGVLLVACNSSGNIFSYIKPNSGSWQAAARVNDVDTVAKENFIALAADGQNAFAVWLDLRNRHNQIWGASSTDGGKTWGQNRLIYASPDTTVCECCKPSVVMKGGAVTVMFRNWLDGNRDLYLLQSSDSGRTFGQAQKLGKGSWELDGCPMDGGGLALNSASSPQTVWNRKGILYAAEPGREEKKIGEGRGCTVESVRGANVYAWTRKGAIIIQDSKGLELNLGKGQSPLIKALDNGKVLCVWEHDKQLYKEVLSL